MRLSSYTCNAISLAIFGMSIFVWILLLINPGNIMTLEHCHVSDSGPSAASLKMLLEMNPVSAQLAGWGLMVAAMMLPKLIIPIQDIYARSLRRSRFALSLIFTTGYMAVWMGTGLFMIAIISGLHLMMPGSWLPAIVLGFVAIVWQFSPIKQRYLNRGHDHWTLAAFGWRAGRDSFKYGITHGLWCVGSGWAIMLLPMIIPSGHNLAMIIVTFIMLSEHMENPRVPGWRIDFRAKLLRIIIAQAQIKLRKT